VALVPCVSRKKFAHDIYIVNDSSCMHCSCTLQRPRSQCGRCPPTRLGSQGISVESQYFICIIFTALVFGGLLSSATDMFIFVAIPKCVSGTRDTPYPFSAVGTGGYTPLTGPNAPSARDAPFCTQDALFKSVVLRFLSVGWFAFTNGAASADQNQAFLSNQPFCTKRENGTCPSCDATGGNSMTVSSGPAVTGTFVITNNRKFELATGGNGEQSVSATSYNNFPITFSLVSGSMPAGVTAGKTYYLRNFNRGPQPGSFKLLPP
jgi:hypothetical protein